MRLPQKPPKTQDNAPPVDEWMKVGPADERGRYLPWEELRRKQPPPHGWTHERWWAAIRIQRMISAEFVPELGSLYGHRARFVLTDDLRRQLHGLDRNPVNRILLELVDDPETLTQYRVRELIEEAIDSSMIEGAKPTTRDMARDLIRRGRPPANRSERMIANNWNAMKWLLRLRDLGGTLDRAALLELHEILGDGVLETERPAGEFRGDELVTVMDLEGLIWHEAPARPGLEARIDALLRFAQPSEGDRFLHPIVRAILCHFWLAYEHPFCDGNGRVARALYYWVMLRENYEIAEFLSISGAIRKRGQKYYRAFAYCEAEGLDLTYFVSDQLASIQLALEGLVARLRRRKKRTLEQLEVIEGFDALNHRQRALLDGAIRHPGRRHTVRMHQSAHGVAYLTARKDLKDLVARGLLVVKRVGREDRYRLSPHIQERAHP